MNKKSKLVNDRRKRIKRILIEKLGGQCCCCGYDRYDGALEFHHVNPSEKKFSLGKMVSKSLGDIVKEIQKCVLLCSNCHKEVHDGITKIPFNAPRLSESFVLQGWKKYTISKYSVYDECPICGNRKKKKRKYCSSKCFGIANRKVDRPSKDELINLIKEYNWTRIGKMYGVTDNTIRKWARSYKII